MSSTDVEKTILAQVIIESNRAGAAAVAAEAAAQSVADKAPLNSPAFTGVPTAPTPPWGTNSTQIITAGFVTAQFGVPLGFATLGSDGKLNADQMPPISITAVFTVGSEAEMLALDAAVGNIAIRTDLSNAAFILTMLPASTLGNWTELATSAVTSVAGLAGAITAGALTAALNAFTGDSGSGGVKGMVPAPAAGDAAANKFLKASGAWATISLSSYAPLASPAFTGVPTAPTAAADTNTGQLATASFVIGQAGSATPQQSGSAVPGTSLRYSRQDHVHPTDTSRAPIDNPAFTGNPTAPNQASNDNSTRLANTSYADGAAGNAIAIATALAAPKAIAPATNTANRVPRWNGANSKTLSDGLDVGTSANNLVQLNGSAQLPAVSGALLTNLPATGQPIPTSSTIPVGMAALCVVVSGTVSNGSTTAGSNLQLACPRTDGTIDGGATQTGTWLNISGLAVVSAVNAGLFVRQA